ncbi:esterase-like activity of phytase family protein [Sphingomonas arenae]|uniref:esterase-like activity of phytase family protein n=1 Tax=Sphingomonas arenae TaxID=2812555 RepID=UPI001966D2FD|nr:esterase-like activity of phytase family protein [Sphingomonas arenae]
MTGGDRNWEKPNRTPRGIATVPVRFEALPIPEASARSLPLAGLWEVRASDPRLGGLSGLALDGHRLLAVTDDGAVIGLPKPGGGRLATFQDLPAGPGPPFWKKYRDSESLTRDPSGRGWWVGFEFQHSLYLFSHDFTRALHRVRFPQERWPPNESLEAVIGVGRWLLLVPETGQEVWFREADGAVSVYPLSGADGQHPADAVRLPDGRMLVLLRSVRPWGIANRLAWLKAGRGAFRLEPFAELPLGAFDNVEGVAAERGQAGGTRLWLVTDNDFSDRRRTLLIALDLPEATPASSRRP